MDSGRRGWNGVASRLRRSLYLGLTLTVCAGAPTVGQTLRTQTLEEKVVFASRDIGSMWDKQFQRLGRPWSRPRVYVYSGRIQTPCGRMGDGNAQYCPRNYAIYLNEPFVYRVDRRVGDFAAVTVLAHEYGHAVEFALGLSTINRYPVQDELQADCFAGVYAQDAMSRKLLDPSDIPEATAQSYASGDTSFDLNSHGTPQQRVKAFQLGYVKGFQSCLSYSVWRGH
jgi:uncharacterized protein